jgi:hypothetical protein
MFVTTISSSPEPMLNVKLLASVKLVNKLLLKPKHV